MRRATNLLAAMGLVILLAGAMVLLTTLEPNGASRAEAQPPESTDQQQATSQARATAETKSGVFNLRYGDPKMGPEGEPHGNSRVEYVLTDGKGQETELQLSEETARPLGGPLTLNGKGVEVEGTRAAGGKFKVEKIRRDKQSDAASAFEADALTGPRPNASILCRFGDSTGVTPHAPSWFDTEVSGASAPSLDHYWRETSYNNINLTGSQVFGWYDLPQPRSAYFDASGNANLDLLAQDCAAAADAQVFFPSYTNINLMFNDNLDCCAWGGGYTLTADGQTRTYGTTWMPPWAYNNQYVLAHETGHSFGLPHSSGPYSTPYDSYWDPMSSGGACSPPHSVYGCLEDHTISFHKDRLNWIPASRKYTATLASDQNITLERLAMPASTSGFLMAQIPIGGSSTEFYTVEARRFAGYDNIGPIPGEAVVIHRVNTTLGDRLAQVVDPDGNSNPNDASAMWLPGETFTDSANGISVKVTGATSSGFTVNINPSAPSPPNDNFANAQSISGTTVSVGSTTRGATRENSEPDHYTSNSADSDLWVGDHSVWYRWTAPTAGPTTIDTCQANIDSILAVYTGTALTSLSRVADNNNDFCGGGWGSKVTFNASAGTTYQIAVGDAGGLRESTFTLKVVAPPDTTAPKVTSTVPAATAKGVAPGANITATFSKEMDPKTLITTPTDPANPNVGTSTTFKLMKAGTTNLIPAVVSYDPTTKKATLNPNANLKLGTKYKAAVTTGAKDLAGNQLDQDQDPSNGLQQKGWSFTIKN